MTIPVFKPSIRRKEMDAVLSCMVNDSLWPGQIAEQFLKELSLYLGVSGGICFREYSCALNTALDAFPLEQGDSVILSPLSPAAYHKVLSKRGLKPLWADVDESSACIDPKKAEELLSLNPKALLVHNPLGVIPDMEKLSALGLPILEDITTSVGGHTGEKKTGTYGQAVIIRFEPEDILTTGGGTAVLAASKKELGLFKRTAAELSSFSLLSDLNAALGLAQLKTLEQYIQRRRDLAALYTSALSKSKYKTLIQPGEAETVYYSFPVVFTMGIKDAVQFAKKMGIDTAPAFGDSCAAIDEEAGLCGNAKSLLNRTILFPLYPMLGKKQAETIARVLSVLP